MTLVAVFALGTGNPFRGQSLVGVGRCFSLQAQLVPSPVLLHVHPPGGILTRTTFGETQSLFPQLMYKHTPMLPLIFVT